MWTPEEVVAELVERGDVWPAEAGMVGLRGATLAMFTALERSLRELALTEADDEWRVPATIGLDVLARAQYFESFPQWLTLASHLTDDEELLARLAASADAADAVHRASLPAQSALPPAVCYHAYAALAGRKLAAPTLLTAQGTCWRHEGSRHAALDRSWAFTMREIVCLGTDADTVKFVERASRRTCDFAASLGLEFTTSEACDPFFAPSARGKALLQRVKSLKHELLMPIGPARTLAAASFNQHERFFGQAFDITTADGTPASTACVAFGIERWLLALLCAHGPDAASSPRVHDVVAGGMR